jgi:hypothetical protein
MSMQHGLTLSSSRAYTFVVIIGVANLFADRVGGSFRMSFRNFTTGNSHSFGGEYVEIRLSHVWAHRNRLLARPSYARALDEARPYRHMFPLGAPEGRD